jgi:hypothetical protein
MLRRTLRAKTGSIERMRNSVNEEWKKEKMNRRKVKINEERMRRKISKTTYLHCRINATQYQLNA